MRFAAHLAWSCLLACGSRSKLDVSPPLVADAGAVDARPADAASFEASDSSDAPTTSACPFSTATFLVDLPTYIVGQIAIDTTLVYYLRDDDTIWTVPKTGGSSSPFAAADTGGSFDSLSTFAMDDDFLYYESSALDAFVRRPKQGGAETNMGPTEAGAAVVKGPDALYVWSFEGAYPTNRSLIRIPLAGGPSSVVTNSLPADLTDILVDGAVAYLATREALVELSLVDGTMVSHANVSARHLAMDAAHVYASAYPGSPTTPIFSFLKSDGSAQYVTSYDGEPNAVVLDGPWLYFGDSLVGLLHRVAASGGNANEEIGFPGDAPNGIAIDGNCIYWGGEEGVFVAPK